jgi:hypothetical protein
VAAGSGLFTCEVQVHVFSMDNLDRVY